MMLQLDEEEKKKREKIERKIPWYLRSGWNTFFLIVCPIFIYIFVVFNLKKLDKETKEDRLFWATIFASGWFVKFFFSDQSIFAFIYAVLGVIFSAFLVVIKFSGGHLKNTDQ